MIITALTSAALFAAALICRHYAGGHLTPPSGRMSTIKPAYWLTKEQRAKQELLRSIGSTALWLSVAAAVVAFVQWVRM